MCSDGYLNIRRCRCAKGRARAPNVFRQILVQRASFKSQPWPHFSLPRSKKNLSALALAPPQLAVQSAHPPRSPAFRRPPFRRFRPPFLYITVRHLMAAASTSPASLHAHQRGQHQRQGEEGVPDPAATISPTPTTRRRDQFPYLVAGGTATLRPRGRCHESAVTSYYQGVATLES